jgi:hypothetical protein
MAFVVGCVVGSCNEVSVSLASRRKARRVGVWIEDDEEFGASKAMRSAAAVSISCWMFGAIFTMLWELGVHSGRVAAGGWRPLSAAFPPAPPALLVSSSCSRGCADEDDALVDAGGMFRCCCDIFFDLYDSSD